jgi:hypothetical protein
MDLWSDDPAERLAAAGDPAVVGDSPRLIGETAPVKPWPFGMPSSINPFVVFLGASPGGSPPAYEVRGPYALPRAGVAHPKLYVCDGKHYWDRVRELGSMVVQAHAPNILDSHAHALIGQLNLGTGQFGRASNAPFEPEYCRWVPEVLLDYLRPSYVILLGLLGRRDRLETDFDPLDRLGMRSRWNKPDECLRFDAYKKKQFKFRIWNRPRPDGKPFDLSCGRSTPAVFR